MYKLLPKPECWFYLGGITLKNNRLQAESSFTSNNRMNWTCLHSKQASKNFSSDILFVHIVYRASFLLRHRLDNSHGELDSDSFVANGL